MVERKTVETRTTTDDHVQIQISYLIDYHSLCLYRCRLVVILPPGWRQRIQGHSLELRVSQEDKRHHPNRDTGKS